MGSLSDTFFGGDLDGALKQAKELSLDDNELVGMSLSLQQSQAAAMEQKAQSKAKASEPAGESAVVATPSAEQNQALGDLSQIFGPFADYLTRLQEMIAQANSLFDSDKQKELSSWIIGQQQGVEGDELAQANEQFSSFNQRMQQALAAYQG